MQELASISSGLAEGRHFMPVLFGKCQDPSCHKASVVQFEEAVRIPLEWCRIAMITSGISYKFEQRNARKYENNPLLKCKDRPLSASQFGRP